MIHVLYHGYCYDGFGSAYAAWLKLGDNAEYTPVQHGKPLPDKIQEGDEVYICDFAYPRNVLLELNEKCSKLQVLDHHVTAQADLEGLPFAKFDLNMSGAGLTWEYFHPDDKMPLFIQHLQDRDLWKFELDGTKEVHAYCVAVDMSFDIYKQIDQILREDPGKIYRDGEAMMILLNSNVKKMCQQSYLADIEGYVVPFVNATCSWSEVGEELLRRYPDAPFAVSYFDRNDGRRQFSLRSAPGKTKVNAIAKKFGGGGHDYAAGFQITMENSKELYHQWCK